MRSFFRHEFETRALTRLLAVIRRDFAFHVADPFRSVRAFTINDPTNESGPGGCNYLVTWTFAALLLFVATSFSQEQAKPPARSVSPDGKWELRAGAAGEQDNFVIAKTGGDETSLVLSEEEYAD